MFGLRRLVAMANIGADIDRLVWRRIDWDINDAIEIVANPVPQPPPRRQKNIVAATACPYIGCALTFRCVCVPLPPRCFQRLTMLMLTLTKVNISPRRVRNALQELV